MQGYTWGTLAHLLTPSEQRELAGHLNVAPDISDLAAQLANEARIAAAIRGLDTATRQLLRRIWLAGGQMSPEQFYRGAHPEPGVFGTLAQRGLLVQLRLDYYHNVYALPLEVQQQVARLLVVPEVGTRSDQPLAPAPAMPVWSRDLFRIVSHCRWFSVPLTQQGEIYKRVQQQMAATLWPEHPRSPLARLDFLVRFADWAQVLRVDRLRGQVQATVEAEVFWRKPPAERWALYRQFWMEAVMSSIQLGLVVWDLLMAAGPAGIPEERVTELLLGSGILNAARARVVVQSVVDVGLTAGMVDVRGKTVAVSREAYAAWSDHVAEDEPPGGLAEPTGDFLLPAETAPGLLWEAEAALALQRADVMWRYRFDRAALERAVTLGLDLVDIQRRAQAVCRTPLADNVRSEMEDALRRAGRVRLASGTVVWTQDERAAAVVGETLAELDPLALAPGVLLLRDDQGAAAAQRLYKLGYALRNAVDAYGSQGRYRLADPEPPEHPYHPQIQVALPRAQGASREAAVPPAIHNALSNHQPVTIEYIAPGKEDAVVVRAILTDQRGGLLHGIALETLRPVTIPLEQVVRAWAGA